MWARDAEPWTTVDVLGWSGTVVPKLNVLGVCVDVVVRVDLAAHAARRVGPVLDRDVLSTWEWPEAVREPEVVRLVGVLAGGGHWRRALAHSLWFAIQASRAANQSRRRSAHCSAVRVSRSRSH